jgi:hypothetical protein
MFGEKLTLTTLTLGRTVVFLVLKSHVFAVCVESFRQERAPRSCMLAHIGKRVKSNLNMDLHLHKAEELCTCHICK